MNFLFIHNTDDTGTLGNHVEIICLHKLFDNDLLRLSQVRLEPTDQNRDYVLNIALEPSLLLYLVQLVLEHVLEHSVLLNDLAKDQDRDLLLQTWRDHVQEGLKLVLLALGALGLDQELLHL